MAKSTALLVIDVQVAMFDDSDPPHAPDETIERIGALISVARTAGIEVMYIRHTEPAYPPMSAGAPGWQVHPEVAPAGRELIFDKYACDSFYDTGLEAALRERGIERVVISGLQTDLCVDTTSRSALHRGFDVILASDGHTTWPRNGLSAEQIIAHHNACLADVPHPTATIKVLPVAEIAF